MNGVVQGSFQDNCAEPVSAPTLGLMIVLFSMRLPATYRVSVRSKHGQ